MSGLEFNCLPTIIGSMPQKDADEACAQIFSYLKQVPVWPQLPRRSYLEDMCVQYIEGFPGLVIKDDKMFVDRGLDIDKSLEQLYVAYLENDVDKYPISAEHAAGLHKFLENSFNKITAVKGQVTGPVTLGMTLTDNDGRAIAYDDILSDALAKMLKLRAGWMEKELSKISGNTIIFLDEPYLTSIGSSFFALSKEVVKNLLNEVFSGIKGAKGMHCCGNSDWGFLMSTDVEVLSFDAYHHAESLALYPDDVKKYIESGRVFAWGIVPNYDEAMDKESPDSLLERLEAAMAPFTRDGIPLKTMLAQGLLTPSCGMAGLSVKSAAKCFELLNGTAEKVRAKYF